ncbi:MAG: PilZ domain-containing protein [Candidatus Omnitrophica bacterium]|nr:PilZ domain-containing protein [Candidatus Omnitrophota bacterium]
MQDKRRFARLRTTVDVTYQTAPESVVQRAETKDLSHGGICLVVRESLAIGSVVHLTLTLRGIAAPIACQAKVRWLREVRPADVGISAWTAFEAGLEFEELTAEDQEALRRHYTLQQLGPGET